MKQSSGWHKDRKMRNGTEAETAEEGHEPADFTEDENFAGRILTFGVF